MNSAVVWVLMPCSSERAQHFVSVFRQQQSEFSFPPASSGFLLGLLFGPEERYELLSKRHALSELHRVATSDENSMGKEV
jgi:hypothetical protein